MSNEIQIKVKDLQQHSLPLYGLSYQGELLDDTKGVSEYNVHIQLISKGIKLTLRRSNNPSFFSAFIILEEEPEIIKNILTLFSNQSFSSSLSNMFDDKDETLPIKQNGIVRSYANLNIGISLKLMSKTILPIEAIFNRIINTFRNIESETYQPSIITDQTYEIIPIRYSIDGVDFVQELTNNKCIRFVIDRAGKPHPKSIVVYGSLNGLNEDSFRYVFSMTNFYLTEVDLFNDEVIEKFKTLLEDDFNKVQVIIGYDDNFIFFDCFNPTSNSTILPQVIDKVIEKVNK